MCMGDSGLVLENAVIMFPFQRLLFWEPFHSGVGRELPTQKGASSWVFFLLADPSFPALFKMKNDEIPTKMSSGALCYGLYCRAMAVSWLPGPTVSFPGCLAFSWHRAGFLHSGWSY